jgi:putative sugar O-methyltransferase
MYELDKALDNKIAEDASRFYQCIKKIYAETGYDKEYPLNFFWGGENMRQLMKIINSSTNAREKIALVHQTFMFSVNTENEVIKERMVDWYIGFLNLNGIQLDDFSLSIQESPVSNLRNAVRRGDRLLAPDFLRTLILTLEIKKYCQLNHSCFNVLELGAGYGGLARTLKLFFPRISYAIIDIPETLYFSSLFLRLNFPDAKVCFVTDPAELSGPVSDYDFIFIPTKFAEVLLGSEFELFCNTASLGEMKNEIIKYWMDFIQNKVNVHYFFGLNRFLNTVIPEEHNWRLNENICSISFDPQWRILKWELEPPFTRCPYLETIVTRNLEVIAERMPVNLFNVDYAKHLSEQVADSLATQDWFLHANANNTMLLRDNPLAHDLTHRGILFKLWESIRLYPRAENVGMMLTYLKILMKEKPFEEMFFYDRLLNQLKAEVRQGEELTEGVLKNQGISDYGASGTTLSSVPYLIEENVKGFNIVHYGNQYYALAQSLGPIDLTQTTVDELEFHQRNGQCFIGETVDEVRNLIGSRGPARWSQCGKADTQSK